MSVVYEKITKKIISLLISASLVITVFPISHLTAFAVKSGDFEYELNRNLIKPAL